MGAAGGPGLISRTIKLRVPPVRCLWGPGKGESSCLLRIHAGSCQPLSQAVHSDSISTRLSLPGRETLDFGFEIRNIA